MTARDAQAPLAAAFPRIAALLEGDASPPAAPGTAVDALAETFGLDGFARDVLLLAAYAELEPEAGALIAKRQNGDDWTTPTVGLALAALPDAHWSALAPEAPLRQERLIRLGAAERATGQSITLPEPVLLALLGAPALGDTAAQRLEAMQPPEQIAGVRARLATAAAEALAALPGAAVQLCGPDHDGKLAAAAHALAMRDVTAYRMPGAALPAAPADARLLGLELRRDMKLIGSGVVLDAEAAVESAAAVAFAETLDVPLIVAAPDSFPIFRRPAPRIDMERPRTKELAALWQAALKPVAARMNGAADALAAHFALPPESVRRIGAEIARRAEADPHADLDSVAWDACRAHARPHMDDLAQRIDARATWSDIVLPEPKLNALKAIAAQVRQRTTVYGAWGFDEGFTDRGLGVTALFAGPSGAGKTMAAEVLANEVRLDLYRIDLSAVVSKWIGETEKNLRRVFDAAEEGAAILLFDEADALFGKRSEVKDSHDRYANIEVSYLLQRLEAYRGLAILTTNLRAHVDDAFLRRLRFAIDFPFPAAPERAEIWRRAFPTATPTQDLSLDKLAQLNLVGGSIRNIALNAAFIAADRGGSVTMSDLLDAARLDYEKAGRALTSSETRGWTA